jgi:hypothetical protein
LLPELATLLPISCREEEYQYAYEPFVNVAVKCKWVILQTVDAHIELIWGLYSVKECGHLTCDFSLVPLYYNSRSNAVISVLDCTVATTNL